MPTESEKYIAHVTNRAFEVVTAAFKRIVDEPGTTAAIHEAEDAVTHLARAFRKVRREAAEPSAAPCDIGFEAPTAAADRSTTENRVTALESKILDLQADWTNVDERLRDLAHRIDYLGHRIDGDRSDAAQKRIRLGNRIAVLETKVLDAQSDGGQLNDRVDAAVDAASRRRTRLENRITELEHLVLADEQDVRRDRDRRMPQRR